MILARLQAEWRLKCALTIMLNLLFWSGYELLGWHAFSPLRAVPTTWLDRAVPFAPQPWGWVYLSQFSFTGIVPWLLSTRADIRRYATGFGVMTVISFTTYFFLPTAAPWPSDLGSTRAMQIITTFSGSMNTMPSLHAAFLVYMAALVWRIFGRMLSAWVILGSILWGGAILYSTIATRQHYAWDLVAGAVLGWIADAVAWQGASAAATMPVKIGSASISGVK